MNKKEGKVFVWPICTRIIHWTIALSFVASFVASFEKSWLHYHVAFGWIFGAMLLYRILWGFVGPRYATFDTFKFSLKQLKWYFVEKAVDRWRQIPPGHNPASSWYTIIVLFFGTLIVMSGLLLYGIQEGRGVFAFLNQQYAQYMLLLLPLHKWLGYILVAWVVIHILGVLVEQFYHKTNMVFAMLSGYKKCKGRDAEISIFSNVASYLFIILSFVTFVYIVSTYDNLVTKSIFVPTDYTSEHLVYATDCGECHETYPPFMFPERSWRRIMRDLDNHFGEEITDANISKSARESILSYLESNAAEHSTHKIAIKILDSLQPDEAPKTMTRVQYWRDAHQNIPPKTYAHPKIKDRSNCFGCHQGFERGIFENDKILYP